MPRSIEAALAEPLSAHVRWLFGNPRMVSELTAQPLKSQVCTEKAHQPGRKGKERSTYRSVAYVSVSVIYRY